MSLLRRSIGELKTIKYDLENVKSSKQRTNTVNGNVGISDLAPFCDLSLCLKGLTQDPLWMFVESQKASTTPVRMPRLHLDVLFHKPNLDFSASEM